MINDQHSIKDFLKGTQQQKNSSSRYNDEEIEKVASEKDFPGGRQEIVWVVEEEIRHDSEESFILFLNKTYTLKINKLQKSSVETLIRRAWEEQFFLCLKNDGIIRRLETQNVIREKWLFLLNITQGYVWNLSTSVVQIGVTLE